MAPAPSRDAGSKSASRIAGSIRQEILRRGLPHGHVLGSQAELAARFKVGRSTLREAIRQLEAHGIVRTQLGRNGGLVVKQAADQSAGQVLATYLEIIDVGVDELFEALSVMEVRTAGLAAEYGDEEQAGQLRTMAQDLQIETDPLRTVSIHLGIRQKIAEMAGNSAMVTFIGAIYRSIVENIAEELTSDEALRFHDFKIAAVTKRRVVEAIVARHPSAAEQAMAEDLENRRKILSETFTRIRLRERQDGAVRGSRTLRSPYSYAPKLAQIVALRITHRISDEALVEDCHLGTEADLLAMYEVSRAVFREAIRILELHGLVYTRRGTNGGLMVGKPDPKYTINIASAYLRHLNLRVSALEEFRGSIAIATAQLAAARRTADDVEALKAALDRQLSVEADAMPESAMAVQIIIADASRNRALSLFMRVILAANWPQPDLPMDGDVAARVGDSHRNLFEAFADGDPAMMRRRMVEHIQLVRNWNQN